MASDLQAKWCSWSYLSYLFPPRLRNLPFRWLGFAEGDSWAVGPILRKDPPSHLASIMTLISPIDLQPAQKRPQLTRLLSHSSWDYHTDTRAARLKRPGSRRTSEQPSEPPSEAPRDGAVRGARGGWFDAFDDARLVETRRTTRGPIRTSELVRHLPNLQGW